MFKWMREKLFRRKWLEMSFGELLDKIAILRVKLDRLPENDPRLPDIEEQECFLTDALWDYMEGNDFSTDKLHTVAKLLNELKTNANTQWDFEDAMSRIGDDVPIPERLEAMKGSYLFNRKRAILKKEVDKMFGEKWYEVKHYSGMTQNTGEYKL